MNLVTKLHCFKHFFYIYGFCFRRVIDSLPHLRPHRHVHPAQRSRVARPDTAAPRFAGGLTGVMQGEVVVVIATRSLDPPAGTTGGVSYSVGGAARLPHQLWLLPHQLHGLPHHYFIDFESFRL